MSRNMYVVSRNVCDEWKYVCVMSRDMSVKMRNMYVMS